MTSETDGLDDTAPPSTTGASVHRLKVEQLKQAIERGEYSIEEKLIAEKIIADGALGELN